MDHLQSLGLGAQRVDENNAAKKNKRHPSNDIGHFPQLSKDVSIKMFCLKSGIALLV